MLNARKLLARVSRHYWSRFPHLQLSPRPPQHLFASFSLLRFLVPFHPHLLYFLGMNRNHPVEPPNFHRHACSLTSMLLSSPPAQATPSPWAPHAFSLSCSLSLSPGSFLPPRKHAHVPPRATRSPPQPCSPPRRCLLSLPVSATPTPTSPHSPSFGPWSLPDPTRSCLSPQHALGISSAQIITDPLIAKSDCSLYFFYLASLLGQHWALWTRPFLRTCFPSSPSWSSSYSDTFPAPPKATFLSVPLKCGCFQGLILSLPRCHL